jgi:F-type H+-transporting ATPase subunit b
VVLGTSNFLVPNGTFFIELAAFLIVIYVLGRYVLPYISKPMEERQAIIRQALVDAEEAKRRSAEAEEEYKRVVGEARSQARVVIDEANKTAEQLRADRRQQAEREYEQRVASAAVEIDAQTRRASEDLRRQAADLAITVAERVIGEGLDEQVQRKVIDRTIAEVQAQGGSAGMSG